MTQATPKTTATADERPAQFQALDKVLERAKEMVRAERARQDAKWGVQDHDPPTWSVILTEEGGEYGQEVEKLWRTSQTIQDPITRSAEQRATMVLAACGRFAHAADEHSKAAREERLAYEHDYALYLYARNASLTGNELVRVLLEHKCDTRPHLQDLLKEAVQFTAVAVAILDCLRRNNYPQPPKGWSPQQSLPPTQT
jgi:hypothetical protein